MRDESCPLCGLDAAVLLRLRFNQKLNLPTAVEVMHCENDNFLFTANGTQRDYDTYYASIANDTYHKEISGGGTRSVISNLQKERLVSCLGDFFDLPRRVFDFGCGDASLLVELALQFPSSHFVGFDPSPAASSGKDKSSELNIENLEIVDLSCARAGGPYDLVIASHVAEHLLDFDLLSDLGKAVADAGLLYIEVPDALKYGEFQRREFLYYFDRLHVNHFTPESLANLARKFEFAEVARVDYSFPYRDGGRYPALGMLFRKGTKSLSASKHSARLGEIAIAYISQERSRAREIEQQFLNFEGILVWGAGDNFFRSAENGGPLSNIHQMVVLDRKPQKLELAGQCYSTVEPIEGLQRFPWPVIITISEGRKSIADQVRDLDPLRPIFFV